MFKSHSECIKVAATKRKIILWDGISLKNIPATKHPIHYLKSWPLLKTD